MNISTVESGTEVVLMLSGRFDITTHRDFRESYKPALQGGVNKTINVNMDQVAALDSSALGMLLLLNEKASAANIEVVISACPQNIMKILEIANFGKIFKINNNPRRTH